MSDEIERSRLVAISSVISVLKSKIEEYEDEPASCSCKYNDNDALDCDAIVLGGLIKKSKKIGLWPLTDAALIDTSLHHLKTQICELRVPTLCKIDFKRRSRGYYNEHEYEPSDVDEAIRKSLSDIEGKLCGLDLIGFMPKSQ